VNASVYRDDLRDFVTVYSQRRVNMPVMGMPVMGMAMPTVNMSARSFANVDATMSGAEVEGVVSLTERWFVSGDVSGVRGRQDPDPAAGITSVNLAEIPPVRSRLSLRYDARKPRGGYFMEAEGVYSASQDAVNTDVLEEATPGYFVANARAGVQFGAATVTVGLANLLDRAYVEHLSYQRDPYRSGVRVYEPGRNFYTVVNLRF
jgi:iron complex outermembrane receptor protein